MLLMADLKAEVEMFAIRILNQDNVKVLCAKADMFGCSKLLKACAQLMVEKEVSLSREEVRKMPDATVAYLEAFKVELSKRKNLEVKLEKQQEIDQEKKRNKERVMCHMCGSDNTYDLFCNFCDKPLMYDIDH